MAHQHLFKNFQNAEHRGPHSGQNRGGGRKGSEAQEEPTIIWIDKIVIFNLRIVVVFVWIRRGGRHGRATERGWARIPGALDKISRTQL
jgi:hypothetical protein